MNACEACVYEALERTSARAEGEDGRQKVEGSKNTSSWDLSDGRLNQVEDSISGIDFLRVTAFTSSARRQSTPSRQNALTRPC